jgi:UDP-glucuronate 4-epimerase
MARFLVTGAAGFIGFHLCQRLLQRGDTVIGVDNLNDYYDVSLKKDRLARLKNQAGFAFHKVDVANNVEVSGLFGSTSYDVVLHMAAQAGVRYSLTNPREYIDSNLVGFANVLEASRHHGVRHLVYASSSSVYGANRRIPFSVHDNVDHPLSLYAATKKANELMAHAYSHLFSLPTTGLRIFTAYGPWGRPDMAVFKFTKAILAGEPIELYNHGLMSRDFTYIDDLVEGILRLSEQAPVANSAWSGANPDPATSSAPYRVFNLGNSAPEDLARVVAILEQQLGKTANKRLVPMQPGDVQHTYADVSDLEHAIHFKPSVPLEVGLQRFVEWYRSYYRV